MLKFLLDKVRAIAVLIGLYVYSQLGIIALGLTIDYNVEMGYHSFSHLQIAVVTLFMLLTFVGMAWYAQRHQWWSSPREWLKWEYLLYVLIGLVLAIAISSLSTVWVENSKTVNQATVEEIAVKTPASLFFLMAVIVGPIGEELIFRGCFFKDLFKENSFLAMIFSSLGFAFVHSPADLGSWLSYGGMGVILGYLYYKTKRIEVPIALHILNNLLSVVLMYA